MITTARGISLSEVMVALVIGLFLLAGVAQVFFTTKQSFLRDTQVSDNEAEARFLLLYMDSITRMAGFRSEPPSAVPTKFSPIDQVYSVAFPFVDGTNSSGLNGSDSLTIRYQGTADGTTTDCLGTVVGENQFATNIFSVNGSGDFQCRAVNETAGTDITQVITRNIDNFKVRFGEDLNRDGVANRYVSPNYAGLNTANVVSIRIGFVMSTEGELSSTQDTATYNVLGTVYNPADDGRERRLYTRTIYLRNITSSGVI